MALAHCMRRFRRPKPIAYCNGWTSTIRQHASWLNMVELEIGVLRGQCLDRRKKLISEIAAWLKQRNKAKARIKWMFNTEKARTKLARAYPDPAKES
jgi:hypothetical protein